jgi:hypothetical protein
MIAHRRIPPLLWLGDGLVLLVISLIGFFFHNADQAYSWRWLATFLPFGLGWALIAPWMGLYRVELIAHAQTFWRAPLAAFLAAPFAAWLRGGILNSAVLPLFVLVLGLNAALGLGLWRLAWVWISRRTNAYG